MALYAGEDQNEIFAQLNALADRYPDEIEFYVPQLCTYLFHFSREEEDDQWQLIKEEKLLAEGIGKVDMRGSILSSASEDTMMDTQIEGALKVETVSRQEGNHRKLLEEFLMARAVKSVRFAHLIFWYLLAGIDDSESI